MMRSSEGEPGLVTAVTWPRSLGRALLGDLLTAGFTSFLRLDAGFRCRHLVDARGQRQDLWNRYVGDQVINSNIVLLVVSGVPTFALIALDQAVMSTPLPFWAEVLSVFPLSLGMSGLVMSYFWRRRWNAWTAADIRRSMDRAAHARPQWLAGGVAISIALAWLLQRT